VSWIITRVFILEILQSVCRNVQYMAVFLSIFVVTYYIFWNCFRWDCYM